MPNREGERAEPRIADHVSGMVRVLVADMTCDRLDELFRSDPSVRCVAVRGEIGTLGMIMRGRFAQAMAGPYGFGRALLARRHIGALADWNPLVLDPDTPIEHAGQMLRQRRSDNDYDDILVAYGSGFIGRVSAAEVFDSVARRCADQAAIDPLTALGNRRAFLRSLQAACRETSPGEAGLAVAFIDLDGMKRINDTYGHQAGDAVLIAVARCLRLAAPDHAIVARLGGDEFAVLVRGPFPNQIMGREIGERLRSAVGNVETEITNGVPVRASVGVAVSEAGRDANALLKEADSMMYAAKRSGGDTVVVSDRFGPGRDRPGAAATPLNLGPGAVRVVARGRGAVA